MNFGGWHRIFEIENLLHFCWNGVFILWSARVIAVRAKYVLIAAYPCIPAFGDATCVVREQANARLGSKARTIENFYWKIGINKKYKLFVVIVENCSLKRGMFL